MDHIDKTFIEAIFTPDYYKGYKALENYVVKIVFGILQDMSIIQHMQKNFVTADEIIERFNLHAQSRPLLKWMLYYLEYMGYVKNDNARFMVKEKSRNER